MHIRAENFSDHRRSSTRLVPVAHRRHEGLNQFRRVRNQEIKVLVYGEDGHDGILADKAVSMFLQSQLAFSDRQSADPTGCATDKASATCRNERFQKFWLADLLQKA